MKDCSRNKKKQSPLAYVEAMQRKCYKNNTKTYLEPRVWSFIVAVFPEIKSLN